ncbi:MAG TPA: tetratricopeptide repeat protein [Candidatus Angelobacter sp.]|nr:tetratricopeptide repeat protein [Candidatus Angelobacter sp.]
MATAPRDRRASAIPDELLQQLRVFLVDRQVSSGVALLDAHAPLFSQIEPRQRNAAALVGAVAQWVDIGYRGPELLEEMLTRFPPEQRAKLPVSDYLQLRTAEGLLCLLKDDPDEALRHFDLVLTMQSLIEDKELVAVVHFWNARCHRKKGEYDEALKRSGVGRELAMALGFPKMAAVMRVLESWLLFQKGHFREASRILDQAEMALRSTDDDITLGNIYSAHGRMIRRQGQYKQALQLFTRAIEHFRRRNPQHRNLARSLANIAYVQRLIAAQIIRQLDTEAARRRKGKPESKTGGRSHKQDYRAQYEELRTGAFANLEQAEKIYRHHRHRHGIGNVLENRGLLYLDSGELDKAAQEAALAYTEAKEHNDAIVIARARMLQCKVEHAQLEEEIEGSTKTWERVQAARDYAREAVESASHTQNQRLLARAYTWRGLTASHPAINDVEDARYCLDKAATFMANAQDEDVWNEMQLLKHKVTSRGSVDPRLRAWTQGVTEGKSLQKLTEEFAALVIPRVWEKEGKKVQRVARALRVSPKKVRRILAKAGKR